MTAYSLLYFSPASRRKWRSHTKVHKAPFRHLAQPECRGSDLDGIISPMPTNTLSASLASIELQAPDSPKVRLGTLWETSPAVIVFLRHYG